MITRPKKPLPRYCAAPALQWAARPDPTPILLASGLEPAQVEVILQPYGLQRIKDADANLQSMAGDPHQRRQLAVILPSLLEAIGKTADPDLALNQWERWLASGVSRSAVLEYLRSAPRMVDLVCVIFGNSNSLASTLVRDPLLLYWLAQQNVLSTAPTKIGMERTVRQNLETVDATELKLDALRRFRRREMLRIGVRDLLRLADVVETTASLSDLASVLIDAAYHIVDAGLRSQYGIPMHRNRQGRWVETGFTVIGMGKLGGHELNYSSDVDVLYVCESHEGETRPAAPRGVKAKGSVQRGLSNEEYFEILARELTKALTEQTHEGYLYRVDLRLRAEGSVGQLTRSLDEYDKYYRTRGQVWERLALLKAWPIAGSQEVGKSFVKQVRPFVLGAPSELSAVEQGLAIVEEVRSVKERIDAKMAERGQEQRNVKLGGGGIREIEFFVQTIQALAGRRLSGILDRGTIGSLARLHKAGILSAKQQGGLTRAYQFLRDVEHKLQMVHDMQTHALPDRQDKLERCAIRMGYTGTSRSVALNQFQADHAAHRTVVHDIFRSFFETPKTSKLFKAVLRAIKKRNRPIRRLKLGRHSG
ncbi:MAG: Bifunctional glutamine synthetase adenylyltransferase/adenylyl-removing enzyme [Nitrospira sp.]|nr:Bifunctional glutamine synthetase adenylyltransferase/adenylyl-removing enzyme [Nitrospira sp.]